MLGIAHAVSRLEPHVDRPFFLFLGDIYFDTENLASMVTRFLDGRGIGGVLACKREPNLEAIKRNFIVLVGDDGFVHRVIEKPRHPRTDLKGCGIYLFDLAFFGANAVKLRPSSEHAIQGGEQPQGRHQLGGRGGLLLDLLLALAIAGAQAILPWREHVATGIELARQRQQRLGGIGDDRLGRTPVLAGVGLAAIECDDLRLAPDVQPVVEPEVVGHAGEHDHVGLAQRGGALVSIQQRVAGAEQATRHAREVDRRADALECVAQPRGLLGSTHGGLAAHHDHRALGPLQQLGGPRDRVGERGR